MTEADFLKSILETPDDEVVRLAYADWLMEQGDSARSARGEFIQVQIQLARRTESGGNPADWADAGRIPELRAREQTLLETHGATWASPIRNLVESYTFHRGFIEQITLQSARFHSNLQSITHLVPLRRLRLVGGLTPRIAESDLLTLITELDFSRSQMGEAGLRTLLSSPHLGKLQWLDLSNCYLTDRGAEELARSPVLAQLRHLNLGYNLLSIRGVQTLFASQYWNKMKSLVLTGNYHIDSRAQTFLAELLQDSPNPSLLRSMLQTASREEREYTNRHVRDLAARAGQNPTQAAEILSQGLHNGRRKVRSGAAQMLARLGSEGAQAVPKLVQRLFEDNALVRDHVAPALARLLPDLPAGLQRWLCLLANPLLSPQANLRAVLEHPQFPDSVREQFAACIARRLAWWHHIGKGGSGPAPVPEPGSYPTDTTSVRWSLEQLLHRAADHGVAHHGTAEARAENREAAWALARLTELLSASLPAEKNDPPAPPPVRRGRWK